MFELEYFSYIDLLGLVDFSRQLNSFKLSAYYPQVHFALIQFLAFSLVFLRTQLFH